MVGTGIACDRAYLWGKTGMDDDIVPSRLQVFAGPPYPNHANERFPLRRAPTTLRD